MIVVIIITIIMSPALQPYLPPPPTLLILQLSANDCQLQGEGINRSRNIGTKQSQPISHQDLNIEQRVVYTKLHFHIQWLCGYVRILALFIYIYLKVSLCVLATDSSLVCMQEWDICVYAVNLSGKAHSDRRYMPAKVFTMSLKMKRCTPWLIYSSSCEHSIDICIHVQWQFSHTMTKLCLKIYIHSMKNSTLQGPQMKF